MAETAQTTPPKADHQDPAAAQMTTAESMTSVVRNAGLLVAAIALVGACANAPGATQAPGSTPTVAPHTPGQPDGPAATPPTAAALPSAILEPILEQAASLASVQPEQILIMRAEPHVWPDASLGCPAPDEMYTQALVNGYWVVVQAGGQEYDFRVGEGGEFKLCPADPGGPTPSIEIPPPMY